MPSDWIYGTGDALGSNQDRNTESFIPLGGRFLNIGGDPENTRQLLARVAYTWSNVGVRVTANALTDISTLHARVGGVDQAALGAIIPASSTGFFEDATGSVAVAATDLINYRLAAGTGGHGSTMRTRAMVSHLQHATLDRPTLRAFNQTVTQTAQGTTEFMSPIGAPLGGATESDFEYTLRQAVTFSNFRVFVRSNTTDANSTVDMRVNGVSSALGVTVPSNATGAFEDTGSASVSSGDRFNYRMAAGSGMAGDFLDVSNFQMLMEGSVEGLVTGVSFLPESTGLGFNAFLPFDGNTEGVTPESLVQVEAPVAVDFTNLHLLVTANTFTTASATFSLRLNSADSGLLVTVAAGMTGVFEDSDVISVAVNDDLSWNRRTDAGGAGAIVWNNLGLQIGAGSVPPVVGAEPWSLVPSLVGTLLIG